MQPILNGSRGIRKVRFGPATVSEVRGQNGLLRSALDGAVQFSALQNTLVLFAAPTGTDKTGGAIRLLEDSQEGSLLAVNHKLADEIDHRFKGEHVRYNGLLRRYGELEPVLRAYHQRGHDVFKAIHERQKGVRSKSGAGGVVVGTHDLARLHGALLGRTVFELPQPAFFDESLTLPAKLEFTAGELERLAGPSSDPVVDQWMRDRRPAAELMVRVLRKLRRDRARAGARRYPDCVSQDALRLEFRSVCSNLELEDALGRLLGAPQECPEPDWNEVFAGRLVAEKCPSPALDVVLREVLSHGLSIDSGLGTTLAVVVAGSGVRTRANLQLRYRWGDGIPGLIEPLPADISPIVLDATAPYNLDAYAASFPGREIALFEVLVEPDHPEHVRRLWLESKSAYTRRNLLVGGGSK